MMAERPQWLSRLTGQGPRRPKVPDGTRVYGVGDIHGRRDLLDTLLQRIWTDAAPSTGPNTLVFLGDYVDRGPFSKDVIGCLLTLERPGWDIVPLRGNHEQMLLDFCLNPEVYRVWRGFGGAETILSYGVRPPQFDDLADFARARDEFVSRVPKSHLEFLKALPYFHVVGDYLFVHAGVQPVSH